MQVAPHSQVQSRAEPTPPMPIFLVLLSTRHGWPTSDQIVKAHTCIAGVHALEKLQCGMTYYYIMGACIPFCFIVFLVLNSKRTCLAFDTYDMQKLRVGPRREISAFPTQNNQGISVCHLFHSSQDTRYALLYRENTQTVRAVAAVARRISRI